MAVYNVFIKLLDGTTATLKFPTPTISIDTLKSHLQTLTQIPPHHQRLITGTKQLHSQTLITLPANEPNSITIHLLLRLLGGKGGFGSLLRGAANKAGQKKTNNFDACRDMSGRRLRHVNAEKRMEEWNAEEKERMYVRKAEDFLRKNAKKVKKSGGCESEKYVKKAREDSEKCREMVDAAVKESFGKFVDAKRRLLPSSGPSLKRMKVMMEEKDDDDDSDSDSDEEDEGVMRSKDDGEGSSKSVFEGPSPDTGSSDGGSEEENANVINEMGGGSASVEIEVEANGVDEPKLEINKAEENVSVSVGLEAVQEENDGSVSVSVSDDSGLKVQEENDGAIEADGVVAVTVAEGANDSNSEKPLDFGDYSSAAEMEVVGMERLKSELQAHGLKCGGTLPERAARLFLLKTTPVEKLPKKLLAKN